jgi:peroxiredoxin
MKKIIASLVAITITIATIAQDAAAFEGLKVGDVAPNFETTDNNGKKISLAELLKTQQVVLFFYRGQWCPYCNKQLKQVNDKLVDIQNKGARVLAIAPETAEGIAKTYEKTKASFSLISDKGLRIMNSYKVTFALDEKTQTKYKGYGIDLNIANGENGANLPVPATYVIGKDGKIKYAFFNKDYSKRANLDDVMAAL